MDESQEAIDHYAAEDARIAANDFRAHTCGECAWAARRQRNDGWNVEQFLTCRYSSCKVFQTDKACPAYHPREAQP